MAQVESLYMPMLEVQDTCKVERKGSALLIPVRELAPLQPTRVCKGLWPFAEVQGAALLLSTLQVSWLEVGMPATVNLFIFKEVGWFLTKSTNPISHFLFL
jgi:hypothetical protein